MRNDCNLPSQSVSEMHTNASHLPRRVTSSAINNKRQVELIKEEASVVASHSAATARALLIGKMMIAKKGKFKAARFFRPKDFAVEDIRFLHKHPKLSAPHHAETRGRIAKVVNFISIYGAGLLLFEGYTVALKWLETYALQHPPIKSVDENTADARRSALAGAFGGLLYGLAATPMMSLLRSGGPYDTQYAGPNTNTLEAYRKWFRSSIIGPFRYTLPRDVGGFAIYFGTYTFLKKEFWESDLVRSYLDPTYKARETLYTEINYHNHIETEKNSQDDDEDSMVWKQVGVTIGSALLAGSSAGVLTFFWRNPWDSLYKRSMGWESNSSAEGKWWFSGIRFLRSSRGLQAVAISGVTWAAYETAILATSMAWDEYRG